MDANYQKNNLSKVLSDSKHLNDNEQIMLRDVLNKYEITIQRKSRNLEDKTCRYRTTSRSKTLSL